MRLKPRALRPGDTIGLVAPSGSPKDPSQVDRGIAALEELGFRVKPGEGLRGRHGYLAGSDELRARDLMAAFADPEVDGIVCLKGGYGCPRILDALDYGLVARNPKVFAGYSDITALHLAFRKAASLVTFHAPMAISMIPGFDAASRESWLALLTGARPTGPLSGPEGTPPPMRLRGGKARGELAGGNLSLVAATMGTPWQLEARGRILFLEDIDEEPYRVDRMLTQLRLAGLFRDCAGVILGDFRNCDPKDPGRSLTLAEVFEETVGREGKPAILGFQAGHCVPSLSLPLGVEVELDADSGRVELLESPFA